MNKSKKGTRSLVWYTLVILVLFVSLFAINRITQSNKEIEQAFEEKPVLTAQPVMGKSDAAVSIVEFGDYKCPSCKAWGEQIWPQLQKDYVDTGIATFAYVNVLFHGEESRLGAIAGEAILSSNPEDFWAFHKALFAAQPTADHDSTWITEEKVAEIAASAVPSLNKNQFIKNLANQEMIAQVALDQQLVQQFAIELTPTIMINNNKINNPFDYEAIKAAIEAAAK